MKRILILATGGTIVCTDDGQGLRPTFTVDDLLTHVAAIRQEREVSGRTIMNIDSSNMTPDCWLQMAKAVAESYQDFDGFVITHGTDTMAYSAAALAYLLVGLNKPVIFTGAQYSVADHKTDAVQNLHDALLVAGEELAGVFIVFDGKVINGTRAMKTKTQSYDAFESVNYPLIAEIKHNRIRYDLNIARGLKRLPAHLHPLHDQLPAPINHLESEILVLKLFPGLQPQIFNYIRQNFKAIVIESYGTGGISTDALDLATKVAELADHGLIVVVTTQCLKEGVHPEIYEVGRKLPFDKIVYARDMNTEAIVPKLMWAMASGSGFEEIKRLIETPVQGDLLSPLTASQENL